MSLNGIAGQPYLKDMQVKIGVIKGMNKNTILRIVLWGFVALAIYDGAGAGPLLPPIEVDLDLAKHIVIGQITAIEEIDVKPGDGEGVRWGRATVAVKEVLKGAPAQTVNFRVASGLKNYGGSSPPHLRRVGDSGIWLIGSHGAVMWDFGLLPEDRKTDVMEILKKLEERIWSEPVNGLRAWATVVYPDYYRNPVIIFAVKNVSDADIFLPVAFEAGFVNVIVTSQDGKISEYKLGSVANESKSVFCCKLSAGEITYLHPNVSFIDLKWRQNLPPGKYTVVVLCKNEKEGEIADKPISRVGVAAWKGELKAPSVQLVLDPDGKNTKKTPEK
jgi:hypothetical protein